MTVLVTGATGFVGAAIARKLNARGEAPRVLVRQDSNRTNLDDLDIEYAIGDLRDPGSLKAVMRGVRSVYHAAADYRLWARDDSEIYDINIGGTENMLHAAMAAGVERFVYTSSVCTLGTYADGTPANEETRGQRAEMIGAYKTSKFLAEQKALAWARDGAPVVIVNPSTPIGPGDIKPTPTGRMIKEAVQGKMPAFVNTGLNFVHVDDVAEGHLFAHDKGVVGERYILGGYNISLKSLLWLIADLMGTRPPTVELPRQAIYPIAYAAEAFAAIRGKEPFVTVNGLKLAKKLMYFSSAKAQAALGYQFRPVREAVRDAIVWFGADIVEKASSRAIIRPAPAALGAGAS